MSFYIDMKGKYSPELTCKEFDQLINEIESKLFDKHPEYLKLSEKEQNKYVEQTYIKHMMDRQ